MYMYIRVCEHTIYMYVRIRVTLYISCGYRRVVTYQETDTTWWLEAVAVRVKAQS